MGYEEQGMKNFLKTKIGMALILAALAALGAFANAMGCGQVCTDLVNSLKPVAVIEAPVE